MRASFAIAAACCAVLAPACRSAQELPPPAVGHPGAAQTAEAPAPELRGPASTVLAAPALEREPAAMKPERRR